jgi:hypothetical protein
MPDPVSPPSRLHGDLTDRIIRIFWTVVTRSNSVVTTHFRNYNLRDLRAFGAYVAGPEGRATLSGCRSQQLSFRFHSLTTVAAVHERSRHSPLEQRRAPTAFHADPEDPKAAKLNVFG